MRKALVFAVLIALASPAAAQVDDGGGDSTEPVAKPTPAFDPDPDPDPEPEPEPGTAGSSAHAIEHPAFLTTDRFDLDRRVGATLAYLNVDVPDEGAQRLELFGHTTHGTPLGRAGGYAAIGLSRWTVANSDGGATTLGNFELGGLWAPRLPVTIVFRAGYVFQTAGDDLDAVQANTTAGIARFTDQVHGTPDIAWLRAGGSWLHRRGKGFYRVDLGLDWPAAGNDKDNANHIARLNLAAGLDSGTTTVTLEVLTNGTFADVDEGESRFQHMISIGGRYLAAGRIRPGLALALPLDDPADELVSWILILTADYVL